MLCEKFAQEGANVVVNYVSSKDRAEEVAEKVKGHGGKTAVVQAVSMDPLLRNTGEFMLAGHWQHRGHDKTSQRKPRCPGRTRRDYQ
jgi:NAD(P)-dependent dehydrogenase (short-subunit alcohol dehydrogenase family)